MATLGCPSCGPDKQQPATVYMTTEITPESLIRMYEVLGIPAEGHVAVKISTGEPGGHNYLKPELIAPLVRTKDHGFLDIAPFDIMDSEGEMKIPVRDTTYLKYDIVGSHLANYDFMINLAHFKGHTMGGFGGVLKNQSIGVASQGGKCYQHKHFTKHSIHHFCYHFIICYHLRKTKTLRTGSNLRLTKYRSFSILVVQLEHHKLWSLPSTGFPCPTLRAIGVAVLDEVSPCGQHLLREVPVTLGPWTPAVLQTLEDKPQV